MAVAALKVTKLDEHYISVAKAAKHTTRALQDLVGYRKFKNKEVSAAARALVGLFRELAPGMLAKKDRGRDADPDAAPAAFGATRISDRIEVRRAA